MQGAGKLMVWCGIWGSKIVGPVTFDSNLNAEMYLNILQVTMNPSLLNKDGEFPTNFQQDRSDKICYVQKKKIIFYGVFFLRGKHCINTRNSK
jgi:hypothetical protein